MNVSLRNSITRSMMQAALMLSVLLFTACSSQGDEPDSPQPSMADNVQVGLRISLGSTDAMTKATPAGDYDSGTATAYENYIDIAGNDYRVLFFDTSNRYLATFVPTKFVAESSDATTSKTYEVMGKVTGSMPTSFKVVVLANWSSYPTNLVVGVTTIADVCSGEACRYAYAPGFVPSATQHIPMYGVKQCYNVVFRDKLISDLGSIHLLRAMAKVEVECHTAGWTLNSVVLNNYNTAGFSAPADVFSEDDYVRNSYESDYNSNLHVPDGSAKAEQIAFSKVADGKYVIYVPEYRNVDNAGEVLGDASRISVQFAESENTYPVHFKYYSSAPSTSAIGRWFDIRRNYDYRFVINKSNEDVDLDISLDLYPYTIYNLEPGFGNPPAGE